MARIREASVSIIQATVESPYNRVWDYACRARLFIQFQIRRGAPAHWRSATDGPISSHCCPPGAGRTETTRDPPRRNPEATISGVVQYYGR